MRVRARGYRYIGPAESKASVTAEAEGPRIRSQEDLGAWLSGRPAEELSEPFTFVIDFEGNLRLAPRRSEHVVCAGGGLVLSAGEMGFAQTDGGWAAIRVSNQSTGYCPDIDSYPAVATALNRAGISCPDRFSEEIVFRRCPSCRERNVVHEGTFVCALCDAVLPELWNLDPTGWTES
jgi:hypothetical protein